MGMQQGHATWRHGHAAWKHGNAAWRPGHAAWRYGLGAWTKQKQRHAPLVCKNWTCKMYMHD